MYYICLAPKQLLYTCNHQFYSKTASEQRWKFLLTSVLHSRSRRIQWRMVIAWSEKCLDSCSPFSSKNSRKTKLVCIYYVFFTFVRLWWDDPESTPSPLPPSQPSSPIGLVQCYIIMLLYYYNIRSSSYYMILCLYGHTIILLYHYIRIFSYDYLIVLLQYISINSIYSNVFIFWYYIVILVYLDGTVSSE